MGGVAGVGVAVGVGMVVAAVGVGMGVPVDAGWEQPIPTGRTETMAIIVAIAAFAALGAMLRSMRSRIQEIPLLRGGTCACSCFGRIVVVMEASLRVDRAWGNGLSSSEGHIMRTKVV